jgi:WD40 repeat protein
MECKSFSTLEAVRSSFHAPGKTLLTWYCSNPLNWWCSICLRSWNPNLDGQIAVGCKNSAVILFNEKTKAQKLLHLSDRQFKVVDMQWDRLSSSYLLVAYEFFLSLWDAESGTEIHSFEKQTINITSIAWLNWTAGNFVSSNGRNRNLKVWNASQKQPLDTIKFPGAAGINSMTFCAGKKRVLCAGDDGSICVLNVQNRQIEYQSSAGHKETIFDCKMSPTSPNVFCTASYDSTVKVWSISDLSLTTTLHGNGDVIYSCDWSPKGSMIAASSYSGLLTVWDVETGRELARYLHHTKASYAVAWNRHSENLIATTSADGALTIIHVNFEALYDPHKTLHTGSRKQSVNSHRTQLTGSDVSFRFQHPAAVYGCAWSYTHASVIATACHDGIVRVFNHVFKDALMYQLVGHTMRVFGLAWSPLVPGQLASGSDDMTVNIWDMALDRSLTTLSRSEPAPSVSPSKRLSGHTQFVRALSWNFEHRDALLSGSWDATIRLWNTATGECLLVISDHIADVYAIASHPERPFTYISCSRDTTVRVWETQGVTTLLRYNAIWDGCLDRICDRARRDRSPTKSKPRLLTALSPVIHGQHSCNLNATLCHVSHKADEQRSKAKVDGSELEDGELEKFERILPSDPLNLAANFYKLYAFFNGASGSMDVWENALAVLGDKRASILQHTESFKPLSMTQQLRPTSMRQITNENEVLDIARSEARKLGSVKMGARKSDLSSKVEDQLRSAAMIHARAGDFASYCSIMVDLGDWTAALAMAPSVSMDYWKSLCQRYSQNLINESSEQCVPYLLATGKDADAVEFYLRRHDPNNAMVVAKMSEQRVDLIPDYVVTHAANNATEGAQAHAPKLSRTGTHGAGAALHSLSLSNIDELMWTDSAPTPTHHEGSAVRERTMKEVDDSRLIVRVVSSYSAKVYLDSARPMLAAAQFLAVEDVQGAISILSNNSEPDMAYALAQCFKQDTSPHIIDMADRCAAFGAVELSVEMLLTLANGEEEVGLLLSRYCDEAWAGEVIGAFSLRSLSYWSGRAEEEEQIGSDAEAVTAYVIAQQYVRAVRVGIDVLKRLVREPLELSAGTKKLLRSLKYVKAVELDEQLRMQFLLYVLWFSAHEAAAMGLWDTACNMLAILSLTCSTASFALSETDIQYQLLFFKICAGQKDCVSAVDNLLRTRAVHQGPGEATAVQADLRQLADLLRAAPPPNAKENAFLVSAAFKYKSSPVRMAEGVWGDHTFGIMK